MRIDYCCKYPTYHHFQDTNGGAITAVVFCTGCQKIASEIWIGVNQECE